MEVRLENNEKVVIKLGDVVKPCTSNHHYLVTDWGLARLSDGIFLKYDGGKSLDCQVRQRISVEKVYQANSIEVVLIKEGAKNE